ncbi:MAG TPA: glycosyltransferase family 1 protein [Ktedonobacterales bacterium]|nr:glycosyltransferase family 1 protein [Ktedonobacterales bacterium]
MRVAINAQFMHEPHTGTGRYVYNLLSALGRVDGVNDYRALTAQPLDADLIPETPSTFTWEVASAGLARSARLQKLDWEQRVFPGAAKRASARLMHVPYFAPPLRTYGVPVVVTIHDVINLRLPLYRAKASAQLYAQLVAHAARNAAAIIAVSEYSKKDIIELIGAPPERITVISEAPAPSFRRITDPERLDAIRAKYQLSERFLLTTGIDARKNITTLIGAFAALYHELDDPDLQLFIIGDPYKLGSSPLFPDWRPLAQRFEIAEQVRCMPVDEEDLATVYSACACFVFISTYEGFGLTPLEAMACGAPVVCADRTSLPEVVGSAGLLVNPDDPDSVGAALYKVLNSPEYGADLRARGLARVKQFSWDKVAAATSALYADVTGMTRD